MTFDDLFRELRLTPSERAALVHHLASMRYRRPYCKKLASLREAKAS